MTAKRICKVVRRRDPSMPGAYKYSRWVYRVVECLEGQQGFLNERGVRLVWESDFVTYRGGPKDHQQRALASAIAALGNRALAVGLEPGTPLGIISDREQEVLS